ncbi:MAG: hypothetical protein AAFV45_05655 [Pseudomonadota bacterium]
MFTTATKSTNPISVATALSVFALAALALTGASQTAAAHSLKAHKSELSGLIEHGRKTGSITFSEGRGLRKELRRVEVVEDTLRANDGRLDRSERRVLHRLLNSAEDSIKAELYDNQRRLKILPRVGK